jgi:hypothetical protein
MMTRGIRIDAPTMWKLRRLLEEGARRGYVCWRDRRWFAWRDRSIRGRSFASGEASQEIESEDLSGVPARMLTVNADVINPDLVACIKG